jgi:Uma2 family endonuclease
LLRAADNNPERVREQEGREPWAPWRAATPQLVVEVLSPSTESEDRGPKWPHYQQIPSLREYVLVSQETPRVERYQRQPDGSWQYTETSSGLVTLSSGAELDLDALYDDLPS